MKRKPSARNKQKPKTNQLSNIANFLKNISNNTKRKLSDKVVPGITFVVTIFAIYLAWKSFEVAGTSLKIADASYKNQIESDSINYSRDTVQFNRDSIQFQRIDSILTAQNKTILNILESSEIQLNQLKQQTQYLKEQNSPSFELTNTEVNFIPYALMRRTTPETKNAGYLNIEQNIYNKGIKSPTFFYYEMSVSNLSGKFYDKADIILPNNEMGHSKKFIGHCPWNLDNGYNLFILIKFVWSTMSNSNTESYYYETAYDGQNFILLKITNPGRKQMIEKFRGNEVKQNSAFYISPEDIKE